MILDKRYPVINGILCLSRLDRFWVIDFDPETDGLDHVKEMLSHSVYHKRLLFSTVLMDSCRQRFDAIEQLDKHYYCPLKYLTPMPKRLTSAYSVNAERIKIRFPKITR